MITKGNFTAPSFTSTTKGWHIVAKGDSYQGSFLASKQQNMLKFVFKNEHINYISGFNIAGRSPPGATIDYSGVEIGMGNVPIPGVSLFIDPSNNRGGGGAKTSGAIRIGPVGNVDTGELQFMELSGNGINYVGFKAPDDISSNIVWKLPNHDGSANTVLKTDGAGNLDWRTSGGFDSSGNLDMSCNSIVDVSNITFCGHGGVGIDLSCNTIVDVSSITFCDGGTYFGPGASFDISTNQVFKIRVTDTSNALVVDQSGNVGIGTADPSYNLDIHDLSGGDMLRLRAGASAPTDIEMILGTTIVGGKINAAVTTNWQGGTNLYLQAGGTTVATITPGPLSAPNPYPNSFNLSTNNLTIGAPAVAGTAGQVLRATGVGAGVEWGTGSSDGSGNAAIPYEPWNLDITLSEQGLIDQTAYYIQFDCQHLFPAILHSNSTAHKE